MRQRLAHRPSNRAKLVRERLQHRCRVARLGARQMHQDQQTRRPLDQRAYRAGIAFTLNEVGLPVTGEQPILNLRRAHVQVDHVHYLAAALLAPAARHAFSLSAAHQCDQITTQLTSGHGIDGVVDSFVGHTLARLVGMMTLQVNSDLFGRPLLLEQCAYPVEQSAASDQFRRGAAEHAPTVAALLCKGAAIQP